MNMMGFVCHFAILIHSTFFALLRSFFSLSLSRRAFPFETNLCLHSANASRIVLRAVAKIETVMLNRFRLESVFLSKLFRTRIDMRTLISLVKYQNEEIKQSQKN